MSRIRKGDIINGVLLLDKPSGMSSNKALQQCKFGMNAQKAGHTGSLDPLATGLLPLCFGHATKISSFLLGSDKTYSVSIQLGETTDTADADGKVIQRLAVDVNEHQAKLALAAQIGAVDQIPPMYSALKINGQTLYKLARKGIEVERKARRVTAYDIRYIGLSNTILSFDVDCSSGFYVRTLAETIGEALHCGAHVKTLRRIKIGDLEIHQTIRLASFLTLPTAAEKQAHLLPADQLIEHLSAVTLTLLQAKDIAFGRAVNFEPLSSSKLTQWLRIYDPKANFLGLGQINTLGQLAPKRMFI